MVGVIERDSLSTEEARRSLSMANDFSNLLIFTQDRELSGVYRRFSEGWMREEPAVNTHGQPIENVLRQLAKLDTREGAEPMVVLSTGKGSFGIITATEASSDVPAFWLLKRLAVIESSCRDWLVQDGCEDVKVNTSSGRRVVPIHKASFSMILYHDDRFEDVLQGPANIHRLVRFRNNLVHSVIADESLLDLAGVRFVLDSIDRLNKLIS